MDLNDDDVYRVERIVAYDADEDLFQVKWEGYDDAENTWEPRENLTERLVNEWFDSKNTDDWLVDDTSDDADNENNNTTTKHTPTKHTPAKHTPTKHTPAKHTLKEMVDAMARTHFTPEMAQAVAEWRVWGLQRCAPAQHICACCGLRRTTTSCVWLRNRRVRIGSTCATKLKWLIAACTNLREIERAEARVNGVLSVFMNVCS